MNNISVIGTGYVGLITGACFAEFGLKVICMDVDEYKIKQLQEGKSPIYEPGLEALLKGNIKSGRLTFTTDLGQAVKNTTTVFIAVGTPMGEDGSADLRYVLSAARNIAENMNGYKVIVNKSTVPVGTGRRVMQVISETLKEKGLEYEFDMVSNPEFLREGSAIEDFMHPDRIIIGTESMNALEIMKNVYHVLYLNNHPFLFTNLETAELIKYASNAFLATKITFINQMANLCEAVGANVQLVSRGMGLDGRIGKYFLHAGPGYGGSCFPKDTRALCRIGKEYNESMSLIEAVVEANENQKMRMVTKILEALGNLNNKTIAILGLAFKPKTDDMREAPSITIIRELVRLGASIKAFDPVSMENAKRYSFNDLDIYFASDEYDAADGAHALVLVTEWNQFRSLDLELIRRKMRGVYFFDLRNVYEKNALEEKGFIYIGVGR